MKYIQKKKNVLAFQNNGANLKVKTDKYNCISLTVERNKTTNSDEEYELKILINGQETEDSIYFDENEYKKIQIYEYSINDNVELIFNYENNSGENVWGTKELYITDSRLEKYKEDEE